LTANSTALRVGNATVNSTVTSTGLSFNGTVVANSTVFNRQANGATNLGPEGTGVSLATLQSQITSNSANVVTYLTTNNYTVTGVITYNANVVVNTANRILLGNATVNAVANQTGLVVSNSTTSTTINPGVVTFGGGASVNNTIYTGTANNSSGLGGYLANTTSPSDGFVLAYNLAENRIKWTNPSGISATLSTNSVIANASLQAGSNGSVYALTVEGNTTSTNVVARANNISIAVDSGSIQLNGNTLIANSLLIGNTGANVTVTTSTVTIQNSTTSAVLTQNSFSRQANGATNLGPEGSGVNLSTLQNQITGNASAAYTNATTIAANASNLSTGTVPNDRLSAQVVNTSGAFTITGVHTMNANLFVNTANHLLIGNATVNAVANQTTFSVRNASANLSVNATTIIIGGTAVLNSTSYAGTANNSTNLGGSTLATVQGQITSNSANVVTYLTTNNYTVSGVVSHSANVQLANNHLIAPRFKAYSEFSTTNTNVNANYTVDLSLGNIFNLTLNANPIALTFTNPPSSGTSYAFTLILRQDGTTGNRTVTYSSNCKFTDNVAPVLATGTSKVDVLQFLTVDGGTTYFGAHAFANIG
jgi:hypothetical protein